MARWVALLRGVNVNGVTVRSKDLAECLAGLGLGRVRTVLASGNAVFDTDDGTEDGTAALKARVEAGLRERFGYTAWIVLVDAGVLARVAESYPFERRDATHHPYVVFAADPDVLAELSARAHEVASHDTERIEGVGDVLFWECPKGSSTDTPFAKVLAASRYQPTTTTRTLRTLEKVLAASQG